MQVRERQGGTSEAVGVANALASWSVLEVVVPGTIKASANDKA